MDYIILDLEWNQPSSFESSDFKRVGDKLIFELLQIGAVRLDEQMNVTGQFSQLIRPKHYKRVHSRVKRMTGIHAAMLEDAPDFDEALHAFATFCGEDYALLTWGCDDVSVLEQNMRFFECDVKLKPMYDIQRLYSEIAGTSKDRKSLSTAMAERAIEPDEAMPFHNALNDAYYTALVFRTFPEPRRALEFPLKPRELIHIKRRRRVSDAAAVNVTQGGGGLAMATPACPVCGTKIALTHGFVGQGADRFMALANCPTHGLVFVKLQFARQPDGSKQFTRVVALSKEQSPAYVHTKQYQWAQKLSAQGDQPSLPS